MVRPQAGMPACSGRSAQPPPSRPIGLRVKQTIALLLAAVAAVQGGWAAFLPQSFYDSFPGGGHRWVSILGPYDEHLVRDVGVLNLTLMVVSGWAAIRPRSETFALVGAGWLTFGLPHLVFHLNHLSGMPFGDQVSNVVNLSAVVLLALALAVPFPSNLGRTASS